MSGRSILQSICVHLESERLKDRTQGLQDIREILPSTQPDKKLWLRLLQAIFQIVVDEQRVYFKKAHSSSNPTLKRLKDAAQAVRLVIEKAVVNLPRKAVKAVLNHILSIIVVQGQLFEPVALDYLKALHCLLSYPPHLENLEQRQWVQTLSLCFSSVLGDPVRCAQAVLEEHIMEAEDSHTAVTNASSSYVSGTQRKRKAAGPHRWQSENGSSPSTLSTLQPRSAGQDVIELMSCIELLVSSSEAPLLPHGEALLAKYLRFFQAFPNETSAHLPALTGINCVLKELHFNNRIIMTATTSRMWPVLQSLWPTKVVAVKEQVVISLSILYDFLVFLPASSYTHMLHRQFELIRQECNSRWGIEPLNPDALAFIPSQAGNNHTSPFSLAFIRAGDTFTPTQALSWQVLSLAGKALCVLGCSSGVKKGELREPSYNGNLAAPAKKHKMEDAVIGLLTDLDSSDTKTSVHILQILVFCIASAKPAGLPWRQMLQTLSTLCTHVEPDIQVWAFIASAVIFDIVDVNEDVTDTQAIKTTTGFITNIWKQALRRMSELSTCRSACLLVSKVLQKATLAVETTMPDIELLVRLMDSQGPVGFSDSAVDVLDCLLAMGYADARMQSMSVFDAVYSHMAGTWNLSRITGAPGTLMQPASPCFPLPLLPMLGLLCNICAIPMATSTFGTHSAAIIIDGPIVEYACYARDVSSMRAWYFDARIIHPLHAVCKLTRTAARPAVSDTLASKLTRFLDQHLGVADLLCAGDHEDTDLRIPAESLRRCIELSVLVIWFEITADKHCSSRGLRILDKALAMLHSCVNRWIKTTWNRWQRAFIIQPVHVLVELSSSLPFTVTEVLVAAGEASGVQRVSRMHGLANADCRDANQAPLIADIWSTVAVRDSFTQLKRYFSDALLANSSDVTEVEPSIDEFDDASSNGYPQVGNGTVRHSHHMAFRADSFLSRLCVRWIAKVYTSSAEAAESLRLGSAFPLIMQGSGSMVIEIGKHIMQLMKDASLELHYNDLDTLTERIGGELLPSYEYGRSSKLQKFALQFLQVTSIIWGQERPAEPAFADKARRLAAWFAGQNRKSSIMSAGIRISMMKLLEDFLLPTRSLLCWGHESEDAACIQTSPIPPVTLLISMLSDADFRVRFRLARTCGRIAAYVQSFAPAHEQQGMWEDIAASGSFNLADNGYENNLTLLLTYGNVVVASELFRPLSYMPIILVTALDATRSLARHITALLSGAVTRLQLDSVAQFYACMARYAMAEMLLVRRETLSIPDPAVFGFVSKKQLHEADFSHVGAMVLTGPRPDYFEHMCSYVGMSETTGLSLCMPVVIAFELALRQSEDTGNQEMLQLSTSAQEQIAKVAQQMGKTPAAYMIGIQENIATELIACIHEPRYDTGSLAHCMPSGPCTEVLQEILGSIDSPFRSRRLAPPSVRFRAIIRALSSPHSPIHGVLQSEASAFCIIQHLTFEAAINPFINQQLRLLHNLVLYVSLANHTIAQSSIVLAHLMERLIPLLKTTNLFVVASHLIRWSLAVFTTRALAGGTIDEARCSNILVSFAEIAIASHKDVKAETSRAASLLLTALQMYLQRTINCKISHLSRCARAALCYWPLPTSLHSVLRAKDMERSLVMHTELPNHRIFNYLLELMQPLRIPASQDLIVRLPQLLWQGLRRLSRDYVIRSEGLGAVLADLLSLGDSAVRMPSLGAQLPTVDRTKMSIEMVRAELFQLIIGALHSPVPEQANIAYKAVRDALAAAPELSDNSTSEVMLLVETSPAVLTRQDNFLDVIDLRAVLLAVDSDRHSDNNGSWLTGVASSLVAYLSVDDEFFEATANIVRVDAALAKSALPWLIQGAVLSDVHCDKSRSQPTVQSVRSILSEYFNLQLRSLSPIANDIVDILVQLRRYSMPHGPHLEAEDALSHDKWLELDYGLCAEAASRVGDHVAALLFFELENVYCKHIPNQARRAPLLYRVYENIAEPDSFYSIESRSTLGNLARRLEHEGRWLDAVSVRGANYNESTADSFPVAYALLRHGLPQLATSIFRTQYFQAGQVTGSSTNNTDVSYELAWRTANWNLPVSIPVGASGPNERLFYAFRAIARDTDTETVAGCIESMLSQECQNMCRITETMSQVDTRYVSNLVALRFMQKWTLQTIQDKLSVMPVDNRSNAVFEQTDIVRAMLLANLRKEQGRQTISDVPTDVSVQAAFTECALWSHIADRARGYGNLQTALNAAVKGVHLGSMIDDQSANIALAKVLWAKREYRDAVNTLKAALENLGGDAHLHTRAKVLGQIGTWIATARSERPADLGRNYFDPALEILSKLETVDAIKAKSEVVAQYAMFCDDQYLQSSQRIPEIDQLDAFSRRKDAEVKELSTIKASRDSAASDVGSRRRAARAQSDHDKRIVLEFRIARRDYLRTALRMYAQVLSLTDDKDDNVYRLCGLWLENDSDLPLNEQLRQDMEGVPVHKFIPLVHQLSARLSSDATKDGQSGFQKALKALLTRLCRSHPFHGLYQIHFLHAPALSSANTIKANGSRRPSLTPNVSSQARRSEAAGSLLNAIRAQPKSAETLRLVDTAITAYIDWALYPLEKPKFSRKLKIPADHTLLRLTNVPIPIATVHLPVDKTTEYAPASMPCILRYVTTFTTAGGVHLPKINECQATDGHVYKQLVSDKYLRRLCELEQLTLDQFKGGDDVRQDAVMQQVFRVTNDLLQRDDRAKVRSLAVRTYKVLPLNSEAGLLQFVRNSQPIGEWLSKAHEKYRPQDIKVIEARRKLGEYGNAEKAERVAVYQEVIQQIYPVMRHFFFEKQHIPVRWFEMRLLYARSTAVMSIVGYILGLGDRHVSNILIDLSSGELVPIDLGIAFEAGRTLPTPELVPFRLTRDIVDGFGMSGVEGVFRKCSEETMRVLRARSSALLTILEVFRFDPLQRWTASAEKLKRLQGSQAADRTRSEADHNSSMLTDADRAIATVSQKLNSQLSIEYQVNDLILQATDIVNLALIFPGWQQAL